MKIDNLKDLKALIKLLRSANVYAIKIDGIELTLGAQAPKQTISAPTLPDYSHDIPEANVAIPQYTPVPDKFESDALTPDELLFYSASGQTEQADA
jgi:hypothetical protein